MIQRKALCNLRFQNTALFGRASMLGFGDRITTAGSMVKAKKKAIKTPTAVVTPKLAMGCMLEVMSVKKPMAVVNEVSSVAKPTSLKATPMAWIFVRPLRSSS